MKNATENIPTADRTSGIWGWQRDRDLLIDTLMRTGRVEELTELAHDSPQMCLIDDEQLVQTLFAHGSNPT